MRRPVRTRARMWVTGSPINLLSPVIISFYLSVVPTFIPAGASRWYYLLLAATHVGLAMFCHSMWATALDAMRRWFVAPWTRRVLQAGTGLALIGLALRVLGNSTPVHAQTKTPVPVLAELFTSEGCDSCPPADRLLEVLLEEQPVDGVLVVPLSEHVTYWDHQGWKDPFDSQQFTVRQQQYGLRFNLDSIYTPQVIVDGRSEAVGSDRSAIEKNLRDAAKTPKAELRVQIQTTAPTQVTASASGAALQAEKGAELFFALTEDHLSVNVTRGENAKKTLRHSAVVRVLQSAGKRRRQFEQGQLHALAGLEAREPSRGGLRAVEEGSTRARRRAPVTPSVKHVSVVTEVSSHTISMCRPAWQHGHRATFPHQRRLQMSPVFSRTPPTIPTEPRRLSSVRARRMKSHHS